MRQKKSFQYALSAGLFLLLASAITAQVTTPGDVDGNGKINIIDALQVAQYAVGLKPPAFPQNADVNGDGKVTIVDALMIAQYYIGIIHSFPVSTHVPYLEEFRLAYGQTVIGEVSGISITFSDVSDSRCPLDVLCVWAGEVTITLDIALKGKKLGSMAIKAPPAKPSFASVTDPDTNYVYRIECLAVNPYPASAMNPPAPEEYVATLLQVMAMP